MASMHCDISSCCVVEVFNERSGKDALLKHYSRVVGSRPELSSLGVTIKEEPVDDGSKSLSCQEACDVRGNRSVENKLRIMGEDLSCSCGDAALSNSGHLKGFPILHGETKLKLNKDLQLCICDLSALSKIKVCLDFMADVNSIGIASPNLYVWRAHSSFVWQIEDTIIESTSNYHRNTKLWFVVPIKYIELCRYQVINHLNLHMGDMTCHNYIHSNFSGVALEKVRVSLITQEYGEFISLCHSGCRIGPTIDEAASYATEVRYLGGRSAFKCLPPCHVVSSNVDSPVSVCSCHLSQERTNGNSPVFQHCDPQIGPLSDASGCTPTNETMPASHEIEVSETNVSMKEEITYSDDAEDMGEDLEKVVVKRRGPRRACENVLLVQCPQCGKSYKSSGDRLYRLLIHVKRCHKSSERKLTREIVEKYHSLVLSFVEERM